MSNWDSKKLEELRQELAALERRMGEYLHIIRAQYYFDELAARRRAVAEQINKHLDDTFVRARPNAYNFAIGKAVDPRSNTAGLLEDAPGFGLKLQ